MIATLSRTAHLVVTLTALALASGCGPVDPIEPTPPAPFEPSGKLGFEIGTGDGSFKAIEPGAKVELQYGAQGGQHIWFSARCQGAGSPAKVRYSITDAQGLFVSVEKQTVLPADPDGEGWRSVGGMTAFIDGNAPLSDGMKLVFRGHLEDDYGTELDAMSEAMLGDEGENGF